MTSTQTVKYLRDYAAPAHLVPKTELLFDIIGETEVRITATLHIEPQHGGTELELHGDNVSPKASAASPSTPTAPT